MLKVDIKKRLNNFTLEVAFTADQETLAVLGPSGCGKSMTLKCIAGVETPDEGYIELNGRVLFDKARKINLPPQQRRVGYLFQNYALFPNMTVEENIAAAVQGDKETKKKIAAEKIKAFYLEGLEKVYPAKLSGGQQQRVALARLMAQNPEILMLDEPFSALDNYLRWQLEQEVAEILELYRKPVLLVSHNRKEVYRLCDRVAVLCEGKLEAISSKQELFELPRTVTVARLVGYKNISRIRRLDEQRVFALDWGVELVLERKISDSARYIGFMAHTVCPAKTNSKNTLDCRILRVIENTFSTIVILQPKTASNLEEYNKLVWEMDKNRWNTLYKGTDLITVTLDAGQLLPLN